MNADLFLDQFRFISELYYMNTHEACYCFQGISSHVTKSFFSKAREVLLRLFLFCRAKLLTQNKAEWVVCSSCY